MIIKFEVSYYKIHQKKYNKKIVYAENMQKAVHEVIEKSKELQIQIKEITAKVHSFDNIKEEWIKCAGLQKYCDKCLYSEASYGINENWYCKGCKDGMDNT